MIAASFRASLIGSPRGVHFSTRPRRANVSLGSTCDGRCDRRRREDSCHSPTEFTSPAVVGSEGKSPVTTASWRFARLRFVLAASREPARAFGPELGERLGFVGFALLSGER